MTVHFKLIEHLKKNAQTKAGVMEKPPIFKERISSTASATSTSSSSSSNSSPMNLTPELVRRTIVMEKDEYLTIVEDVMGRTYNLSPPFELAFRQPERFSADAFYETFIQPVIRCIHTHTRLYSYVIVFDKPWFMRPEKFEVQADRSSKIVKYPENAKITAEGIWYRDEDDASHPSYKPKETGSLDFSTPQAPHEGQSPHIPLISSTKQGGYGGTLGPLIVHPINLRRLLGTRPLRLQLWNHFLEKMKQDERLWNGRLIIDFDEKGPFILTRGKCRQATELCNRIGEGDVAAFYWSNLFGGSQHVINCSIDRDLVLIGMLQAKHMKKSHLIQCNANLTTNTLLIHKRLQGQEEGLVLGVMLCGTDYVIKKTLLYFVNDNLIVNTTVELWKEKGATLLATLENFTKLLKKIYSKVTNSRCSFPEEEALNHGYRLVLFNFLYWITIDGTIELEKQHPLFSLSQKVLKVTTPTSRDQKTRGKCVSLNKDDPKSKKNRVS